MPYSPLLLSAAVATAYWLLESFMHAYVWGNLPFSSALLAMHEPHEIWERLTIVALIMGFGIYMQRGMTREKELRRIVEEQLRKRLEELERFSKAAVDREFRIKELRDEAELLRQKIEGLNPQ